MEFPEPSWAASTDIVEEDDPYDTIEVYSGPVGGSMREAAQEQAEETESSDEGEPAQKMTTPDPTPERDTDNGTDGAGELQASSSTARQPEVPSDAVAMGIQSRRRQAYTTGLAETAE